MNLDEQFPDWLFDANGTCSSTYTGVVINDLVTALRARHVHNDAVVSSAVWWVTATSSRVVARVNRACASFVGRGPSVIFFRSSIHSHSARLG